MKFGGKDSSIYSIKPEAQVVVFLAFPFVSTFYSSFSCIYQDILLWLVFCATTLRWETTISGRAGRRDAIVRNFRGFKDGHLSRGTNVVIEYVFIWGYNDNVVLCESTKQRYVSDEKNYCCRLWNALSLSIIVITGEEL